jgi:hypothetical protein
MNRLIGTAALVGWLLAAATHAASLAGIDVAERIPAVWALHVGIFPVFAPVIFSARRLLGPKPSLSQLRAVLPAWVMAAGVTVFVYAMVNFMLFLAAAQGGTAASVNGRYVLQNHGEVIRELNDTEYTAFKANELRGFSGHWLLFYFVPFAYFFFAKPGVEKGREGTQQPSLPGAA